MKLKVTSEAHGFPPPPTLLRQAHAYPGTSLFRLLVPMLLALVERGEHERQDDVCIIAHQAHNVLIVPEIERPLRDLREFNPPGAPATCSVRCEHSHAHARWGQMRKTERGEKNTHANYINAQLILGTLQPIRPTCCAVVFSRDKPSSNFHVTVQKKLECSFHFTSARILESGT